MLLLCSFGAEIMENHQDNLWSLAAQKYFWLIEPEIIKKILDGFLPVRANEPFAFRLFISLYSITVIFSLPLRGCHPLRNGEKHNGGGKDYRDRMD
jgi:hypothetical protein